MGFASSVQQSFPILLSPTTVVGSLLELPSSVQGKPDPIKLGHQHSILVINHVSEGIVLPQPERLWRSGAGATHPSTGVRTASCFEGSHSHPLCRRDQLVDCACMCSSFASASSFCVVALLQLSSFFQALYVIAASSRQLL